MEDRFCNRCHTKVSYQDVSPMYFAYCKTHDEDLYQFETYSQTEILNAKLARENRDNALDQVESNANAEWTQLTLQIIKLLAESKDEFSSDNVWELLADYPNIKTHSPSAMGAMFRRALGLNYIESTDRFIQSERPSSHARPIRVWKSKLKEK